jgi:hypothetical protein
VQNLVSHIKRTQIKGVLEQGAGEYNSTRRYRGLENLHNEELHNMYSSPNIIRPIKSRMR